MFKFNYHDVSINNAKIKARQRESLVPLKVNDIKGQVLAEKLVFDINKNTLDISSTKNRKVNANIKIK